MFSNTWRLVAIVCGFLLAVVGLFADAFGIGKPGFGERQTLLFLAGLLGLAAGALGARRSTPGDPGSDSSPFERVQRAYVGLGVLLLNTLLLVFALNAVLWLGFAITDRLGWTVPEAEGEGIVGALAILRVTRLVGFWTNLEQDSPLALDDAELTSIYPGWTRGDVRHLLRESRGRPLIYQPFSQFGEQAYAGRFVNVSPHGFRIAPEQGPWPMDPRRRNVWVFGGSTTFGYGLPDDETIPTFLQSALNQALAPPVAVYNFGQGYFYSSQGLALFYRLLIARDVRPDAVVFIDGINESMAEPFYSEALRTMVRAPYQAPYARVQPRPLADGEAVVARYLKNRALIRSWCELAGIRPLFVWQPSPAWRYDLNHHLFPSDDFQPQEVDGRLLGQSAHYASLARQIAETELELAPDFLDLSGLQDDLQRPLYVDHLHYTADFSRVIAERIAERLLAPPLD
ncbi:MAG: SGNH/GDSL hydrolase family protein [Acidobacteriota bacterium]